MNLGELIEKLQELELRHGDQLPVYFLGTAPESDTADEVEFPVTDAAVVNARGNTYILLAE